MPQNLGQFRFIHCTDFHQCYRNIAHSRTRLEEIKAKTDDSHSIITSYCGDTQTGADDSSFPLNAWLDNAFRFDVRTLGNHEGYVSEEVFSNNLLGLQSSDPALTPYLASNLDFDRVEAQSSYQKLLEKGIIKTEPYIKETKDGKVGFLAVLPKNTGLQKHSFALGEDHTNRILRDQVKSLKEQGAKVVVLLSHRGNRWDKEFAQGDYAEDIDLIIGGDSHTPVSGIESGKTLFAKKDGKEILVVNSGANGEYVGVTDLSLGGDDSLSFKSNILVSSRNDDEFGYGHASKDRGLEARIKQELGDDIFDALTHLDVRKEEGKSLHERLNQMHYYADLRRKKANAQIGLFYSLELKRFIRDAVDRADLRIALPYNGGAASLMLSGAQIKDMVQSSSSNLSQGRHHFVFAGLRFNFNDGEVTDLKVETSPGTWQDIDLEKNYSLAIWDYLLDDKSRAAELGLPEIEYSKNASSEIQSLVERDLIARQPDHFPKIQAMDWLYDCFEASYSKWLQFFADSNTIDSGMPHRMLRRMS